MGRGEGFNYSMEVDYCLRGADLCSAHSIDRFSSSILTSKAREIDLKKIEKWSNEVLFDIWKMGNGDKDEVLKLVKNGHAVQMFLSSETSQLTVP